MASHPSNIKRGAPLLSKKIVVRAGVVSIFVGILLTLINQWGAVTGPDEFAILPSVLVFQTPFLVVLASQALAIRQANREFYSSHVQTVGSESFFQTAFTHRIPGRAILLGVIMGTLNTAIVAAANAVTTGTALSLPIALISQAFILPVLFGLISQSITYRRTVAQLANESPQTLKGDQS